MWPRIFAMRLIKTMPNRESTRLSKCFHPRRDHRATITLGIVRKTGATLADIEGFPPPAVELLRDELSVTTAEEFVDLARRMAPQLRSLLAVDEAGLDHLCVHAQTVADAVPTTNREFRTGVDPPPGGRDTYQE